MENWCALRSQAHAECYQSRANGIDRRTDISWSGPSAPNSTAAGKCRMMMKFIYRRQTESILALQSIERVLGKERRPFWRRETMAEQRVWNANKTLQLRSPAAPCVLCAHAARGEGGKSPKRRKKKYMCIYTCIFIYLEMIVPGTAGQGPGAHRGRSSSCVLYGGPFGFSHKTSRRATGKGQTGAHEIDFFLSLFFFLHKMLIIALRLFFFPTQLPLCAEKKNDSINNGLVWLVASSSFSILNFLLHHYTRRLSSFSIRRLLTCAKKKRKRLFRRMLTARGL